MDIMNANEQDAYPSDHSDISADEFDEIGNGQNSHQGWMTSQLSGELIGKQKLSRFLDMHRISLDQFWKSNRNHANFDDLKLFCQSIGLRLSSEDEIEIKTSLFSENAIISIYDFCNLIGSWRQNSQEKILEFFKNRTQKMADTMKQKVRLNSASNSRQNLRPATANSTLNQKPSRPMSSTNYCINKSKQYLQKQKFKQMQIEKKLSVAINKAKDEYQYELLIKMSEANDLNKEMQYVQTYRAYKNAQGNLRVRVFNLDRFVREIKLKQFQKEFNDIKKKFNETKKISRWQVLSTSKKDKNLPIQVRNTTPVNQNVKKSQRQKELLSILTETMNLTNILKGQLKILKNQGIYKKA